MDSLGDRLQEAREERGLSIDQVSRDTNISKSFITAIEKEDFSEFPGETYIIGFIRNYAEYLGFRGDDFVQLYRNLMIQEQPIPLEELVTSGKKSGGKAVYLAVGLMTAAAAVTLLILLFTGTLTGGKDPGAVLPNLQRDGQVHEFNASREMFDIKDKDSISLTEASSGEDFLISVEGIEAEKQTVWFHITDSRGESLPIVEIPVKGYRIIDLNGDGMNDIQLTLSAMERNVLTVDIDRTFTEGPRLSLKDPLLTKEIAEGISIENGNGVILTSDAKSGIEVVLSSMTPAIYSFRIDGGSREEVLPAQLGGAEKNLKAEEGILFWMASRFGQTLKVNGKEVSIPEQAGPSSCFFITWFQAEGRSDYSLVCKPLDSTNE